MLYSNMVHGWYTILLVLVYGTQMNKNVSNIYILGKSMIHDYDSSEPTLYFN